MLGPVLFVAFFASVLSYETIGLTYSFDEDFLRTFNTNTCTSCVSAWNLVNYENLKIVSTYSNNNKGIRSGWNSCACSFPIIFFSKSVIELNVYLHVISNNSELTVIVVNESDEPIVNYVYNSSSKEFSSGWNTLFVPIIKNFTGHIKLLGCSRDDEIVLVDSFRYIIKNQDNEYKPTNTYGIEESENVLTENVHRTQDLDIDNYGSGDEENKLEGSGEYTTSDPDTTPVEDPENSTDSPDSISEGDFWNMFTITLVSVGSFVVISTILVSVYYCGKMRGQEESPFIFDDAEPPRTITIPRVERAYPSNRFRRFF